MSCVYNFYNFSSLKDFVHNKTFHCWQKWKVTFVLRSTVIFAIAVYLLFDMVACMFAQDKCHFWLSRKVMTLWHGVFACVCDFCKSCYLGYILHRHNFVQDSVLRSANMKFFALWQCEFLLRRIIFHVSQCFKNWFSLKLWKHVIICVKECRYPCSKWNQIGTFLCKSTLYNVFRAVSVCFMLYVNTNSVQSWDWDA